MRDKPSSACGRAKCFFSGFSRKHQAGKFNSMNLQPGIKPEIRVKGVKLCFWQMKLTQESTLAFVLHAFQLCKLILHTSLSQVCLSISEPHHEKTGFLPMQKQRRRSASQLTAKLISAFVFATRIVQFLFFLNPKFQASSLL